MARVAIQDSDGDAISAANPLPVTLPADAITIGGDLDVRPLTAADVVTAAQGAADYKVTLDGEAVPVEGGNTDPVLTTPANLVDTKMSLDGETVAAKLVTAAGVDVDETHRVPASIPALSSTTDSVKVEPGVDPLPTTGAPGVVGPFVIANGDATGLSEAVEIGATSLEGLFIPAAFTGTVLTFQAALTLSGTYQDLYDDSGTEVSVVVAAGRAVSIDFAALKLAQWRFLKIRSGTAAAPTTEGGERSIHVVTK